MGTPSQGSLCLLPHRSDTTPPVCLMCLDWSQSSSRGPKNTPFNRGSLANPLALFRPALPAQLPRGLTSPSPAASYAPARGLANHLGHPVWDGDLPVCPESATFCP